MAKREIRRLETQHKIYLGDYLEGFSEVEDESIDMIMTSPPYWQARDYGFHSDIGLEGSPREYVQNLRPLFEESMRVLKPTGTFWFNISDARSQGNRRQRGRRDTSDATKGEAFSGWTNWDGDLAYIDVDHGVPAKSFLGIPEMFMFMAMEEGFIVRDKVIWAKGVAYYDGKSFGGTTPSPIKDRFNSAWEYVYGFTKDRYNYFNYDAISIPAKTRDGNKMPVNVWVVPPSAGRNYSSGQKNFATYPPALTDIFVRATCPPVICSSCGKPIPMRPDYKGFENCICVSTTKAGKGTVLDPFLGSGTTSISALNYGVNSIGFEINPDYVEGARNWLDTERERINNDISD